MAGPRRTRGVSGPAFCSTSRAAGVHDPSYCNPCRDPDCWIRRMKSPLQSSPPARLGGLVDFYAEPASRFTVEPYIVFLHVFEAADGDHDALPVLGHSLASDGHSSHSHTIYRGVLEFLTRLEFANFRHSLLKNVKAFPQAKCLGCQSVHFRDYISNRPLSIDRAGRPKARRHLRCMILQLVGQAEHGTGF